MLTSYRYCSDYVDVTGTGIYLGKLVPNFLEFIEKFSLGPVLWSLVLMGLDWVLFMVPGTGEASLSSVLPC